MIEPLIPICTLLIATTVNGIEINLIFQVFKNLKSIVPQRQGQLASKEISLTTSKRYQQGNVI